MTANDWPEPDDDGLLECCDARFREGESYLVWWDLQQTIPELLAVRSELIDIILDRPGDPKLYPKLQELQELLGQVDGRLLDALRAWPRGNSRPN